MIRQSKKKILSRSGDFRKATFYVRNAITNDNKLTTSQLQYPIEANIICDFSQFSGEEYTGKNGVIQGIGAVIYVDRFFHLHRKDYTTANTLPNGLQRNILVIKDYSSILEPNGYELALKIINMSDLTDSFYYPEMKKMQCEVLGRLDKSGGTRF
jgi:hypothetical protein